MAWQALRDTIEQETDRIRFTPPDDVLKIFHYGILDSEAGSYGQNFTALVFAEGDCRALAYYNANYLLLLADDPLFTLEHMKKMTRQYLPLGSEFLGYCGLKNIWVFARQVLDALDELQTKEEYQDLLSAFNSYVSVVHGWVHHYFPWHLGELFPQKRKADIQRLAQLATGLPD